MRIQHSISIAAPVTRVWKLTLDVEAFPNHTPTMTSVELLDKAPLAIGSRARIKQPAQPARVWTVTALEPERRFAWSTRFIGTTITASHDLVESSVATTSTLIVDIEGRFARFIGTLVGRSIMKAITTENQGLKTAAES